MAFSLLISALNSLISFTLGSWRTERVRFIQANHRHRTWPEIRYIYLWLRDRILHQSRGTLVHCMPVHEVIVYTKHSSVCCTHLIHNWFVHNVLGSAGVSQSAQGLSIAWLRWRHSWNETAQCRMVRWRYARIEKLKSQYTCWIRKSHRNISGLTCLY